MRIITLLIVLTFSTVICSCDQGQTVEDQINIGPDSTPTFQVVLPYASQPSSGSGALSVVSKNNFYKVEKIIGSGIQPTGFGNAVAFEAKISAGAIESVQGTSLVIYRDGVLMRMELNESARISTISGPISTPCSLNLQTRDLQSSLETLVIYSQEGPDGECYTDDDNFESIPLYSGINTPNKLGSDFRTVSTFFSDDGQLISALVVENGALELFDGSFAKVRTIASDVPFAVELGASQTNALIVAGNKFLRVSNAGDITDSIYSPKSGESISSYASDEQDIFIARNYSRERVPLLVSDQIAEIVRININSNSGVVETSLTNSGTVTQVSSSANTIAFVMRETANNQTTDRLFVHSVKSSEAPNSIDESDSSNPIQILSDGLDALLYMKVGSDPSKDVARIRLATGAIIDFGVGSTIESWTPSPKDLFGFRGPQFACFAFVSETSEGSRTLKAINIRTGSSVTLAKNLPITDHYIPRGVGPRGLGLIRHGNISTSNRDLFAFDAESGELVRLSDTPDIDEDIYF